ncbi:MAG: hypothetical protein ACFB20_12375 [Opitutales bacterium]
MNALNTQPRIGLALALAFWVATAACLQAAGPRVSAPAQRSAIIDQASAILEKDYDVLWARCEELPNPFVWIEEEPEEVDEAPAPVVAEVIQPVAPKPRIIPDHVVLPLVARKFQPKGVMALGARHVLLTPAGKKVEGDVLKATINQKTYIIVISSISANEVVLTLNNSTFTKQLSPSGPSSYLTKD